MAPQGFQDKVAFVWRVADKLRGTFKQHEYGSVMLPLYSCAFARSSTVKSATSSRLFLVTNRKNKTNESTGIYCLGNCRHFAGPVQASQDENVNAIDTSQGSSLRARHFSDLSGSIPIYLSLIGQRDQDS